MGFKRLLEVVIRRETIFHEFFFLGEVVSTFSYIRLLKKIKAQDLGLLLCRLQSR